MITPGLRRLRRAFPDARIDALIGNWSRQVLINNPHVDNIIPVSDKWFSLGKPINFIRLAALLRQLRSSRYDGVLIFHSNPAICRFGRMIGAPITIAYHYEHNDSPRYSYWDINRHDALNANALVDKYCDLTAGLGSGNLDAEVETEWVVGLDELQWANEFLVEENIKKPVIWIHPGTGVPTRVESQEKQWFVEKYAALITELAQRELGELLIGGTKFERSIARRIQELLCVPIRSMMGAFELRQYAALLSISRLLITNDTGTMHIGGAVGVPTVAIFGPTGCKEKLPMNSSCRAVQSRVPCSPCISFSFDGCLFDEFECMKEISVDRVLSAVDSLIGVTV